MKFNKNHPSNVGLTYWQHLKFAWAEAFRLDMIKYVMLIHGLIPWIWDKSFSEYLVKAQARIVPLLDEKEKNSKY